MKFTLLWLQVKVFESKCMNNEVTIEEYDKNLRCTTKMASDNEQKLDELSRKLGVQEDELSRATGTTFHIHYIYRRTNSVELQVQPSIYTIYTGGRTQ